MHVGVNPGAPRSQRFMSDPQELESQIAVSHLMWMLGITPVLQKSSKCFQLLSHFSSPWFLFLFSDYLKHCKNRDGAITRTCDIPEAEVQCLAVEDKEEEGRGKEGKGRRHLGVGCLQSSSPSASIQCILPTKTSHQEAIIAACCRSIPVFFKCHPLSQ